jgi:HEPN domain-containing protein
MNNEDLHRDYIIRANGRLKAVDTLFTEQLWADVVRESQEVVELALKGLLRFSNIDVPRVHDVSEVLVNSKHALPAQAQKALESLVDASQDLRRDRELAFYGAEDLTPTGFYKEKHAHAAREKARLVCRVCSESIGLVQP